MNTFNLGGENPSVEFHEPNADFMKWFNAMSDLTAEGNLSADVDGQEFLSEQTYKPVLQNETTSFTENLEPAREVFSPRSFTSVSKALSAVQKNLLPETELERSSERFLRPRAEIICDRNHIEGQRIDVFDKRDKGVVELSFKLRGEPDPTSFFNSMIANSDINFQSYEQLPKTPSGATINRGQFYYEGYEDDFTYFPLCDAVILQKDDVRVYLADPTTRSDPNEPITSLNNSQELVRSAIGLVKVEAPFGMEPSQTEQVLNEILTIDLGIPGALDTVSEDSEREYKTARYAWQHLANGVMSPAIIESNAERLVRKEVLPGYTTLVEEGKSQEYLAKYGADYRPIHHLISDSPTSIYRILTQGILSTTERYSRGFLVGGLSSEIDIDTGGADSVFTRIENAVERSKQTGALVIMSPDLLDRTDWYTYPCDKYGSTDAPIFRDRLSPDELFLKLTDKFEPTTGNEQMFRAGIGASYIETIEVEPAKRADTLYKLKELGLTEFNGKPIEQVIVARKVVANQNQAMAYTTASYDKQPQTYNTPSYTESSQTYHGTGYDEPPKPKTFKIA